MSESTDEKSVKSLTVDIKKSKAKPPFKLCFVLRQELGRSYITPSRPKKLNFPMLSPKFYSSHDTKGSLHFDPAIYTDLKEQQDIGPKEKYDQPYLDSHKYGWFSDPLVLTDPLDRRLNFKRKWNSLVTLKTYIDTQDKALKG